MNKVFRKIPSLDFRYEVSKDGVVRNVKSKKIKKQKISNFGYYRTSYRVNKTNPHYSPTQGWDRFLHTLVMEVWGPAQPDSTYVIDHIDRNKLNCDISNLRWVTRSQNYRNSDVEKRAKSVSAGLCKSPKVRRVPVALVAKDGTEYHFNSRFKAAEWLIAQGFTETKSAVGLSRRIATQKHIHGFEIHTINAERLS